MECSSVEVSKSQETQMDKRSEKPRKPITKGAVTKVTDDKTIVIAGEFIGDLKAGTGILTTRDHEIYYKNGDIVGVSTNVDLLGSAFKKGTE